MSSIQEKIKNKDANFNFKKNFNSSGQWLNLLILFIFVNSNKILLTDKS